MEPPSIAQLLLGASWIKWSNSSLFPKLICLEVQGEMEEMHKYSITWQFYIMILARAAHTYSLRFSLFGHRTDYEII